MAQLLKSATKCMRFDDYNHFEHMIDDGGIPNNQNPFDFGYLYYICNGMEYITPGTCIYEFDWYSEIDGTYLNYLCDICGKQYNMGYSNYKKFDYKKLIHEDDLKSIDIMPTATIYNNFGSWDEDHPVFSSDFGGGVRLRYRPAPQSHDKICVYLTDGSIDTSCFENYDMTDPDILGGGAMSDSIALENNILHAYDMGDSEDYRSDDSSVSICVLFNNIGENHDSGQCSIFYDFFTWIYIYSSAGNFQGKTAIVRTYNYYNRSTPIEKFYTFDHEDEYVGYNVIGIPIFSFNTFGGPYTVNYYDIFIR